MRSRQLFILLLALMLCATIQLAGCTHIYTTADMTGLQSGSPLRSIESKTFLINEFKDVRAGIIDGDPRIFRKDAGHIHRYDQPPATAVASAIKRELERNGHKIIAPSSTTRSDYTIDGAVFKFFTIASPSGFSVISTSVIAVKLTVSRIPDSEGVFTKAYEGIYESKGGTMQLNPTSFMSKVLHQALTNMIKDISTDQELAEFLQK